MRDHMILDGLWDVYNQQHMGMCAEACAADFKISRAAQDEFALEGDWNANSLESTGASLRQTAAAASAAGSTVEASRAAEAARLVEAARAALAQRNSQQAQYYLLEAHQLLFSAPSGRE